jgi:hypothetical protein
MALLVVDQLTANGAMHPVGGLRKVVDFHVRPVLAEAVGKHAVGRLRPVKIEDGVPRLEYTNVLHGNFRASAIADLDFNLCESSLRA